MLHSSEFLQGLSLGHILPLRPIKRMLIDNRWKALNESWWPVYKTAINVQKIVCTNNVSTATLWNYVIPTSLSFEVVKTHTKAVPFVLIWYLSYSSSLVKIRGGQEATEDIPFVFGRWLRNHRSLVVVTGEEVSLWETIQVYNQQCFKSKQ